MQGTAFTCQVCGTSMPEIAVVRCPSCATPHHQDCWQYLGGCSTFGCAKASTAPPDLQAAPPPSGPDGGARLDAFRLVEAGGPAPVLYWAPGGDGIELAPGESAVQVTTASLDAMGLAPDYLMSPRLQMLGLIAAGTLVFIGSHVAGPWFLGLPLLIVGQRFLVRAEVGRIWLVRTRAGELLFQSSSETKGVSRCPPDERRGFRTDKERLAVALIPRAIRLNVHVRTGDVIAGQHEPYGEYVLELVLHELGTRDLVSPLRRPLEGAPREGFLRRLLAIRNLGRTLARVWAIPYEDSIALHAKQVQGE